MIGAVDEIAVVLRTSVTLAAAAMASYLRQPTDNSLVFLVQEESLSTEPVSSISISISVLNICLKIIPQRSIPAHEQCLEREHSSLLVYR